MRMAPLARRSLAAIAWGGLLRGAGAAPASVAEWVRFRDRFMSPEGRILDTGNGAVSHSEGQGWGMLLAAAHDDRAAFRLIHGWTRRTLARPGDRLFSWRYRPGATPAVDDPNNATDGDLYIAWALAWAGERWHNPALSAAASAIAHDVLRLLTREFGGRLLLLPGAAGFEDPRRVVVNPSYYVFPAFAVLGRHVADRRWQRLVDDGLWLLRQARFGRWGLPPDWLEIRRGDTACAPAGGWPPRFSFDAVRVPLLLAWAGHADAPAAQAALRFWTAPDRPLPPAWVDLVTGATADFPASEGVRAIAALVGSAASPPRPMSPPQLGPGDDYYSAALKMLVSVALSQA